MAYYYHKYGFRQNHGYSLEEILEKVKNISMKTIADYLERRIKIGERTHIDMHFKCPYCSEEVAYFIEVSRDSIGFTTFVKEFPSLKEEQAFHKAYDKSAFIVQAGNHKFLLIE